MKRLVPILAFSAIPGCAVLAAGWEAIAGMADAVAGVMDLDDVKTAYDGLVALHGAPSSDREFMDMLEQAAGVVFDRREQVKELAQQAVDWLLGAAGMVFGQGIMSGRGRSLIAALFGGVVRRDPKAIGWAVMAWVGGAHSGRVLGPTSTAPTQPGSNTPHPAPPAPEGPATG